MHYKQKPQIKCMHFKSKFETQTYRKEKEKDETLGLSKLTIFMQNASTLLTNQSLEASYISSLPNSAIAFPTIIEV